MKVDDGFWRSELGCIITEIDGGDEGENYIEVHLPGTEILKLIEILGMEYSFKIFDY